MRHDLFNIPRGGITAEFKVSKKPKREEGEQTLAGNPSALSFGRFNCLLALSKAVS